MFDKPFISFVLYEIKKSKFKGTQFENATRKDLKKYCSFYIQFNNGSKDLQSSTCFKINVQRFMSFYNCKNIKELKLFMTSKGFQFDILRANFNEEPKTLKIGEYAYDKLIEQYGYK